MTPELQSAVERLTAYGGGITDDRLHAADLRLVLSRLAALERERKAWRAWQGGLKAYPSAEYKEVVAASAATDATGKEDHAQS